MKTNDISTVLKTMPIIGECEVDIDKLKTVWNPDCLISQWKDEYSLLIIYSFGNFEKVRISKLQAHEIIGVMDLIDEQSAVFKSGRTWRSKPNS